MDTNGISRISPITATTAASPGRHGLLQRNAEPGAPQVPGATGFDLSAAFRENTPLPAGQASQPALPQNGAPQQGNAFPLPLLASSQALAAAASAIQNAAVPRGALPPYKPEGAAEPLPAEFFASALESSLRNDHGVPENSLANGSPAAGSTEPGSTESVPPAEQPQGRSDGEPQDNHTPKADAETPASQESKGALTEEEQQEVKELEARDREVRSHEQAHISAGGGLAGSASYETTQGPDGKSYAVGGEVPIDTSEASSPEGTIAKAQQIRAAALAPAQPSSQDYQVAAQASQMEAEARQEQAAVEAEEARANTDESAETAPAEPGLREQDAASASSGAPGRSLLHRAAKAYQAVAGAFLPVPFGSAISISV